MRKLNKKGKLLLLLFMIIIISIIVLLLLPNEDNTETTKKVKKEEVKVEEKKVQIVDMDSTSRPYAVMINNISVARPLQSGLQDAYIIYEIIVEGGITRYMALFQDKTTTRIGSIRSARHYFLDYVLENDAIYVHHGQSPQAEEDFSSLSIDRIVASDPNTGFRDTSLNVSSEHTLFTSIELLNNGLSNIRTERNGNYLLNYSTDSVNLDKLEGSIVANNVSISYSYSNVSSYVYDSTNKVYKRYVNDVEHTDYVTGLQYTFKNIITYQVENYDLNDGSGKGRQGINNIGSGNGYYITEGYAIPITWEKSSRSSKTIYKNTSGEEIKVNDGNTFIQIQPTGQELVIN